MPRHPRLALVAAATALLVVLPAVAHADPGVSQLSRLRDVAGLPPVAADPHLASGAQDHAVYTAGTGTVGHTQDPTHRLATEDGAASASRSNVSLRWSTGDPIGWRAMVDDLQTAPFHALLHLQPDMVRSGSGYARDGNYEALVIDIRGGVDSTLPAARSAITFPGAGSTTTLRRYGGGEVPDPFGPCSGWSAPTGAPIMVAFPQDTNVSDVQVTSPGGSALRLCWYDAGRYTHADTAQRDLARSILGRSHGLVVLPRDPLATGTHRVRVSTDRGTLEWAFSVGDRLRGASTRVDLPPPPDPRLEAVCPHLELPVLAFRDVYRDAHAHAISCGATWGLLSGRTAISYAPGRTVTRAQAASLTYRLLDAAGRAPTATGPPPFPDVEPSSDHALAITALAGDGLVDGRSDGTFGPDEPVTRAQLAALLSRALDLRLDRPAPTTSATTFTDVGTDHVHHRAIEHLAGMGLLDGYAGGTFRPGRHITRAQVASVLVRTAAELTGDGTISAP